MALLMHEATAKLISASGSWRRPVNIGLVGGVVGVFLSLVGMVEAFSQREIVSGVISMSYVLLVVVGVLTGHLAARRAEALGTWGALASSLLAGLAASGLLALLAVATRFLDVRSVLINASPKLMELLTFGRGLFPGILLLLAAGTLSAGLAALLMLIPALHRKRLLLAAGVVIGMGVLQDLLRVTFAAWGPLSVLSRWLYTANGLTVGGTVALFLGILAGNYAWSQWARQGSLRWRSASRRNRLAWQSMTLVLAAVALVSLPQVLGLFLSEVLTVVGLFLLMGLGLNIVVGLTGLLDLGYVAFFALGAYALAVLTSAELGFFHLPFWAALPPAIFAGVLSGVVLGVPVLKMRGDYLAIVTLGFGEIIRILVLSDFLRPWLGGAQGIAAIQKPVIGAVELASPQQLYYLAWGACLVAAFISWRLKSSRIGRAWMAIREDEDVAAAMGINLVSFKLKAFAAGAALAAMSGAIFAAKLGSIYPHSFSLLISINVLALVIVGGMGNIPGVVVGALALVGLPELLREFGEFRLLVYGAALVAMMLLRPQGLWPEAVRRRQLASTGSGASPPVTTG